METREELKDRLQKEVIDIKARLQEVEGNLNDLRREEHNARMKEIEEKRAREFDEIMSRFIIETTPQNLKEKTEELLRLASEDGYKHSCIYDSGIDLPGYGKTNELLSGDVLLGFSHDPYGCKYCEGALKIVFGVAVFEELKENYTHKRKLEEFIEMLPSDIVAFDNRDYTVNLTGLLRYLGGD